MKAENVHNVKWKIMIIKRQTVSYSIRNLNLRRDLPDRRKNAILLLSRSRTKNRAENPQSRIYLFIYKPVAYFDVKLFFWLTDRCQKKAEKNRHARMREVTTKNEASEMNFLLHNLS